MPLVANSMTTLERLRCHWCGKQMMLARVTPKTPRIDEVTYDCRECNISETVLTRR
jgi:C4-type Zn-finger protein